MITDPSGRRGGAPILIVEDADAAAYEAYCRLRGALESAAALRGRATFAFAGGTTPRAVFTIWTERAGEDWPVWRRLHVFQVDERAVPSEHEHSNWRLAAETFLKRVPSHQADRMQGEAEDLSAEAARCEARLRAADPDHDVPVLDAVLLGMGSDGHIASLFPGAPALNARGMGPVA